MSDAALDAPAANGSAYTNAGTRAGEGTVTTLRAATTSSDQVKVLAVARVMSTFNAYLLGVCGRPLDQMTGEDVRALGTILNVLESLEVERTSRYANRASTSARNSETA
jgi:hypothetical protein